MPTTSRTPALLSAAIATVSGCATPPGDTTVRIATFNASLFRDAAGVLADDLESDDAQARDVAAVVRRVRPDVLLLQEFDFDPSGRALRSFRDTYLAGAADGTDPIRYDHAYVADVNTGVQSGLDLDRDGRVGGPGDAWGYGRFPGQYGMVLLSRFPIDTAAVRTFRELTWQSMPDPVMPEGYWPEAVAGSLRLSSKSHWDVPLMLPGGRRLHVLASHPTPPVFDGPEDRNGRRNHDEIRLWADYLRPDRSTWIADDQGRRGGLPTDAAFVVCGDHNADPFDGDAFATGTSGTAIDQLLHHERIDARTTPASAGAAEAAAAQGGANRSHRGPPEHDTADFADAPGPGNLRLDYVLPSRDLRVLAAGVFWPRRGEPGAEWIGASDHRLVWVDLLCGSAH